MPYQVGDVVNGHRLGADNAWHPVDPPDRTSGPPAAGTPVQPPGGDGSSRPSSTPGTGRPWYVQWWVVPLAAVALLVAGLAIRSTLDATTTSAPTDQPTAAASAAPAAQPSAAPSASAPSPSAPAATGPPAAPAVPAPRPSTATASAPRPSAAAPPAGAAPVAPSAAPAARSGALNTPVRDGALEFTVDGVTCGRPQVGSDYLNKRAQGQFCLVSMTVANRGGQPQVFDGTHQRALDAQGRKLSADPEAAWYIEESQAFLEPITPGGQVRGTIVFDVAQTSSIAELQLHDSAASAGARVKVS